MRIIIRETSIQHLDEQDQYQQQEFQFQTFVNSRGWQGIRDSMYFIKAGVEAIIEDQVSSRFKAKRQLASWNMLSRTSVSFYHFLRHLRPGHLWPGHLRLGHLRPQPNLTFAARLLRPDICVPDICGPFLKEMGRKCPGRKCPSRKCPGRKSGKHGGVIGLIQRALSRASSHIWFERSEAKDRSLVNAPIYPIAMKYDSRFGDAFWNSSEQSYFRYLLQMMTSWALICHVWYLPPMTKEYASDSEDTDYEDDLTAMSPGRGSNIDVVRFSKLMREFGYDVFEEVDHTKQQMVEALKNFSKHKGHEKAHSCVLMIMTHGHYDQIYGVDDRGIDTREFVALLDGDKCPALRDKPKLVFVQACHGCLCPGVSWLSGDARWTNAQCRTIKQKCHNRQGEHFQTTWPIEIEEQCHKTKTAHFQQRGQSKSRSKARSDKQSTSKQRGEPKLLDRYLNNCDHPTLKTDFLIAHTLLHILCRGWTTRGHSGRDDAGQRLGRQAVRWTARPPNADACGGVTICAPTGRANSVFVFATPFCAVYEIDTAHALRVFERQLDKYLLKKTHRVFIGVDAEWNPYVARSRVTSLLQLALINSVYLLDLDALYADKSFQQFIDCLFLDKAIIKLGYQFGDDLAMLRARLPACVGLYRAQGIVCIGQLVDEVSLPDQQNRLKRPLFDHQQRALIFKSEKKGANSEGTQGGDGQFEDLLVRVRSALKKGKRPNSDSLRAYPINKTGSRGLCLIINNVHFFDQKNSKTEADPTSTRNVSTS
ncbi:hypothetical protein niasHT_015063 [Heterodera trifolii]|uniref:Caspase family p20 domain-containing protein n=1 Tax=Heterodera trifolii TaxID=157864 RepID=A0ABD2LAY9_9BILA